MDAKVCGGKLESSLDNIVAVRVAHELLKLLFVHHLLDHDSFGVHIGTADALLDDIGAELLLRQLGNVSLEAKAKRCRKAHVVEIENILYDIVAEGVLDQVEAIVRDLADKLDLLEAGRVIDAALEYTATVSMGANSDTIVTNSIENELSIFRLEVVEALLDDMVAV